MGRISVRMDCPAVLAGSVMKRDARFLVPESLPGVICCLFQNNSVGGGLALGCEHLRKAVRDHVFVQRR